MNKFQFVNELSKLRSSSMFITIRGYRNEFSEVANYSLLFHMSYENALHRSIGVLNTIRPVTDLQVQAKKELLSSFARSLRKLEDSPEEMNEEAYTYFLVDGEPVKGVKLHVASDTLHLYGLVAHKRILMPGLYPPSNRSLFTIEKDRLRRMTPVGRFRQFRILPSQVDQISVQGLSLLPPDSL